MRPAKRLAIGFFILSSCLPLIAITMAFFADIYQNLPRAENFSTSLKTVDIENGVKTPGMSQEDLMSAIKLIRHEDYRCDSVSFAIAILNESMIICNKFRYGYSLADIGGKWEVTPFNPIEFFAELGSQ